jgi:hypothetical protein
MKCTPINLGNGVTGFVCSRGRPRCAPCSACKDREHELLCDHPLAGKLVGRTCSAKLCRRCAKHVDGKDLCLPHAKTHATQIGLVLR